MIGLYLFFLALGVVAYYLTAHRGLRSRLVIALAVFLIPSVIATAWIVLVGDRPPADAIPVGLDPQEGPEQER